jgi:HK97 family phage major capsid protein
MRHPDPTLATFDEIGTRQWHMYSITSMLKASKTDNYNDAACRALSNMIQQQWIDHPLSSPTAYWAPTRSFARGMFGGKRDLSAGGGASTGGNYVAHGAVENVAAATRPLLVLQRAGARMHEVTGLESLTIPAWDSSAAGYWVAEKEAVTAADLTITSGSATPHTAGAQITVSHRLLNQAQDIEMQLTAELGRIVATTVETGLWQGLGNDNRPLGILHTPDAQTVNFAAARPTYAELVSMVDKYFDNGGDPSLMTFFCHPSTLSGLMTTEVAAGTGNFTAACIHGPRQISLFGVPVFPTACITEGDVVLCNPADIHVVYWRSPQIIVNPYVSTSLDRRLTILNDVDVVVNRRHQLVIGRN